MSKLRLVARLFVFLAVVTTIATFSFFCEEFEESELKTDDPSEIVEKVLMPIREFDVMVKNQEIIDPSLLIAWYAAKDLGHITI